MQDWNSIEKGIFWLEKVGDDRREALDKADELCGSPS